MVEFEMKCRTVALELFIVLLFSSILISSSISAQQTKTLEPIADSFIDSTNPSSNYGGKDYLKVRNYGTYVPLECSAFLKFDLSSIPSDYTINSATLEIYTRIVTSTQMIGAHYCSNNTWTELGITHANHPSFAPNATSVVTVASDSTWYKWTITDDVQNAHGSSDQKITVVMKSDLHEGFDYVWFASREYSWFDEYIPKLKISYSPPDTTAPTIGNMEIQPSQPTQDDEVRITVPIADDGSGVKEVKLCYSTDGGSSWNNVSMSMASSSTYTAVIPKQGDGVTVQYYVEAFDQLLNKRTSSQESYTVGATGISLPDITYLAAAGIVAIIIALSIAVYIRKKRNSRIESCRIWLGSEDTPLGSCL